MAVYPAITRPYAFAKEWEGLSRRGQKSVLRSKQARCALRRIAAMLPGVGRDVDYAGLSLRAARYVAYGAKHEQARRLERVLRWRRASAEERAAIPPSERPRF